jgi:hypothetical protein
MKLPVYISGIHVGSLIVELPLQAILHIYDNLREGLQMKTVEGLHDL